MNIDVDAALIDGKSLAWIIAAYRPAWMNSGACQGADREMFFSQSGTTAGRAKQICAGCPVRADCPAFAVNDPAIHGVWGGTSGLERSKLRAQRAA